LEFCTSLLPAASRTTPAALRLGCNVGFRVHRISS
jgi:hypothetical protein